MGGDSGIGRAVAYDFVREGACVAIVYYDKEMDAKETAERIRELGGQLLSLADKGIRVNGVAPELIWMPLIPAIWQDRCFIQMAGQS